MTVKISLYNITRQCTILNVYNVNNNNDYNIQSRSHERTTFWQQLQLKVPIMTE